MLKNTFHFVIIFLGIMMSNRAQFTLVNDINSGADNSVPFGFTEFNGKLYFQADNGSGTELFVYDGVNSPTMVKDIYSGVNVLGRQRNSMPKGFIEFNNKLYFTAKDSINGSEIFTCDVNDTIGVLDVVPGNVSSNPSNLITFNNNLFFTAYHTPIEQRLYRYTATGQTVLAESSRLPGTVKILGVYNDKLYFQRNDSGNFTMYSVDTNNNIQNISVAGLTGIITSKKGCVFRDKFYMRTHNGSVVRYDDTTLQNISVFDDYVVSGDFIVFNDNLFFKANFTTPNYGFELYKYDGTSISLVKDINPGLNGSFILHFTPYNGKLYFNAIDGGNDSELWAYDPTTDSTTLVQNINPSGHSFITDMGVYRGKLYISAMASSSTGIELYSYETRRTTSVFKRVSLNKLTIRQNGENVFVSNQNGDDLKGDYKIYNIQGRLVEMGMLGRKELTIDKTQLSKGLYMVSIQNQTIKFVVE